MVVYACHCLNVRIFADKTEENAQADALETCPLGQSCESVDLIDQGFQFIHKCLVHRVKNDSWTVYVCVPCHLRTHAVNHESRLVVVNSEMKRGEETIQAMKKNPEYSPVFNLLLNPNDSKPRDDDGIQPQTYDTLQKQLGELQSVLAMYLKKEEEAVEQRIRRYEEEQRNKFAILKEKAQNEKTRLVSVLFHNSEGNKRLMASEKNTLMKGHVPLSHSKSANEYGREIPNFGNKGKDRRIRDSSPDVFAMDELEMDDEEEDEENMVPSYRSDNVVKTGNWNNSNVHQSGRIRGPKLDTTDESSVGKDDISFMSTSVPISMPAHARNLRKVSHFDDDIEECGEFDDIPKNMQALSESIQDRDRYIFGDRPRQRVHTGDFTQVNWH